MIALMAMPCWTARQPSHSLAIVGALAKASGAPYTLVDLNILFFRHVTAEERCIWDDSVINLWLGDVAERLWKRHERWLHDQLNTVLATSPYIVAFSVNMWTRYFSVQAARYIKQQAPDTVILFGGVDCFIGEHNLAFLHEGTCDIICQGEAEVAFPKFLSTLATTGWRTNIPGFAYHDKHGRLVDTGRVELPTLMDPQPPSVLDAFDLSQYTQPGQAPFFFSRGCPFTCRFCSETTNFSKFRCRDPAEAFAELVAIVPTLKLHADPPTLDFSDSIFNAHIKQLVEFARLVIDSGIAVRMGAQGHFHHTMTRDVIELLARAGFTRIFWGFESGSQKVINLMKKAFKITDAVRIIHDCSTAGIQQYLPVLVGFPGELPEDFAETVEFILRYRDTPGLVFFQPSPVLVRTNAELHDRYRDFGLTSNEVLHWQDVAASNTYAVRLVRCFVASQAQGNTTLTRAGVAALDYLVPNLNDPAVARDLYYLLYHLFERAGNLSAFDAHINRAHATAKSSSVRLLALRDRLWRPGGALHALIHGPDRIKRIVRLLRRRTQKLIAPQASAADIVPKSAPAMAATPVADPLLNRWLATDKNSSILHELVIDITLDALRQLRHRHLSPPPDHDD